jgi:hypothetical protein
MLLMWLRSISHVSQPFCHFIVFVNIVRRTHSIVALLPIAQVAIIRLLHFAIHWFRLSRIPVFGVLIPSLEFLLNRGPNHTRLLSFSILSQLNIQLILSWDSSVATRSPLALQHTFVVPIADGKCEDGARHVCDNVVVVEVAVDLCRLAQVPSIAAPFVTGLSSPRHCAMGPHPL